MTVDRVPHNGLHERFEGKRNQSRPRPRWIDNVNEDMESSGLTWRGAMDLTKDQGQWRSFIRTCHPQMAGIRKRMEEDENLEKHPTYIIPSFHFVFCQNTYPLYKVLAHCCNYCIRSNHFDCLHSVL